MRDKMGSKKGYWPGTPDFTERRRQRHKVGAKATRGRRSTGDYHLEYAPKLSLQITNASNAYGKGKRTTSNLAGNSDLRYQPAEIKGITRDSVYGATPTGAGYIVGKPISLGSGRVLTVDGRIVEGKVKRK